MSPKRRATVTAASSRGGYRPPCCPNPNCRFHRDPRDWRYIKRGFRPIKAYPHRLQVYSCKACGRRFCAASFRTTYWLRRPELLLPIARMICEGAALRQIARVLGTSHTTVARHVARLGRHCLLFQHRQIQELVLREPLVIDGFESFEFSQYFPFHANLAVGSRSWFLYYFTDSPLRRKGAMTRFQKARRRQLEERLGRADPKAVEQGIFALLRPLLTRVSPAVGMELHSDDHPAYRRALRRIRSQPPRLASTAPMRHCITSSTQRRTRANPLFPVNLADLLLRHGSANHRRETIAFSKRRQGALERLALFTVWRNYVKKHREKGPCESAAMKVGLFDRLLDWRQILRRRLFPAHTKLPQPWDRYYWRRIPTAALAGRQTCHACRYAF